MLQKCYAHWRRGVLYRETLLHFTADILQPIAFGCKISIRRGLCHLPRNGFCGERWPLTNASLLPQLVDPDDHACYGKACADEAGNEVKDLRKCAGEASDMDCFDR